MTDLFEVDDAATPLTAEERNCLIPTYITTRGELNEAEQRNILEAAAWAFDRKRDVLDEKFLLRLHKNMFGKVWKWAGSYRASERNLGVEYYEIQPELIQLLNDVRYWIDNNSFSHDEIAVRFHHRLVAIHPFPNGNGRWSRLAADLLIFNLGKERFTWGRVNLQDAGETRKTYIAPLKAADNHDHWLLITFARS